MAIVVAMGVLFLGGIITAFIAGWLSSLAAVWSWEAWKSSVRKRSVLGAVLREAIDMLQVETDEVFKTGLIRVWRPFFVPSLTEALILVRDPKQRHLLGPLWVLDSEIRHYNQMTMTVPIAHFQTWQFANTEDLQRCLFDLMTKCHIAAKVAAVKVVEALSQAGYGTSEERERVQAAANMITQLQVAVAKKQETGP